MPGQPSSHDKTQSEAQQQHPRFHLNEAIHQPVRLSILGVLVHAQQVDFAFLRNHLGLKDANLSQHLTALESLGFVTIDKGFVGKRARTWVALSPEGRTAFANYLNVLQQIIAQPLDQPSPNEGK